MKYITLVLLAFLTYSTYGGPPCQAGTEANGLTTTIQPCNDASFCRHRCYYKYDQKIIYFDSSDDVLQGEQGLPKSSYSSQYSVAATGFMDVRQQYLNQFKYQKYKYYSNVEETQEDENIEDNEVQSANTQFWGFYPKIAIIPPVSYLVHKVDSVGTYISIDVTIQDKRQLDAYTYTCIKGAHLTNSQTIQAIINMYKNTLTDRGQYYLLSTLTSYFDKDISFLADFNKDCKNSKGASFIEKYREFLNQKYSQENYQRNWFLAQNYHESYYYFEFLGKVLVMYSNYPVCRCSSLRYFSFYYGAQNGWSIYERNAAAEALNKRCSDELYNKFGKRATLINEY